MSLRVIISRFQQSLNFRLTIHSGLVNFEKMPYYAVARGRSVGIYNSWAECEAQVKGFSGARYKKFDSPQSAQDFIGHEGGKTTARENNNYSKQPQFPSQLMPSYPNLKRSYSTASSSSYASDKNQNNRRYSNHSSRDDSSDDEESDSDESEVVSYIVTKQLDDIEKRLNSFNKAVNKIMVKGPKSPSRSEPRRTKLIEPPQPKRRRSDNNNFNKDNEGYVEVYTDGACSANGRLGARAGLGVYWGEGHFLNISKPVSGRATNNCGEIQAATQAIKQALENGVVKLAINTDSQFLINSVTKWMPGKHVITSRFLNNIFKHYYIIIMFIFTCKIY